MPVPNMIQESETLRRRMETLGIRAEDVEESFVRSGGRGGQNVNKLSTCVMLVHRPTGIQVKCQTTRHQAQNRELAWRMLLDKIESGRIQRARDHRAEIEKVRRQKRPRSRAAKERMLADKSRRSEIKQRRRRVNPGD